MQDVEKFFMSVSRRDVFEFTLQGCTYSFVGLFSDGMQSYSFEVIFGLPDNHHVTLYDTRTRNFVTEASYENLIR